MRFETARSNLTSQPAIAVLSHVRCVVQRGFIEQPHVNSWRGTFVDHLASYLRVLGKRTGNLCSQAGRIMRLEAHRAEEDQGRYCHALGIHLADLARTPLAP